MEKFKNAMRIMALLQLFAAGDVVNATGAYVDANTGTEDAYDASNPGLAAESKTFYDKALIELASPNLVYDQLGQKRPIPKGGGKTIEFRKFSSLPKATSPITEGVTPSGNKLVVTPITATVDQYGDYVELTDMLDMTSIDPVVVEATKQIADQAGRTIDTIVREVVVGGTNVMYCPNVVAGAESAVDARYKLTADAKLRVKDVFRASAILRGMNAPTVDGSYVAVIHPYVANDLMIEAGDQWFDTHKYTSPENIYRGEIGMLGNVRFLSSTEAKIIKGKPLTSSTSEIAASAYTAEATAEATYGTATTYMLTLATALGEDAVGREILYYDASTTTYIHCVVSGVTPASKYVFLEEALGITYASGDKIYPGEGGAGGIGVFATMFCGANAYGVTDIAGGGIEHIVKQKGYGDDPLNQRSSVGWKAVKAAARLVEEYMLRVESGSAFSTTTLTAN